MVFEEITESDFELIKTTINDLNRSIGWPLLGDSELQEWYDMNRNSHLVYKAMDNSKFVALVIGEEYEDVIVMSLNAWGCTPNDCIKDFEHYASTVSSARYVKKIVWKGIVK